MNRDAANVLQNAPSPCETAGTDTLRLLQRHQVLEMRLVGRDGLPAAGRARDGIHQPQVAPRDKGSGDTWVNQGTPLCPHPHPWQGCLWVEVKMGLLARPHCGRGTRLVLGDPVETAPEGWRTPPGGPRCFFSKG